MNTKRLSRAALLLALAFSVISRGYAFAGASDYEFQLVQTDFERGNAVVAVRLTDKRSGQPVPDAVIFAIRLDMEPDGMEAMTTTIEALPAAEPGIYRFKANLTMEGGWRLSLAAKVQGEAETVESRLVLKALP
jgi:hypothetical protein